VSLSVRSLPPCMHLSFPPINATSSATFFLLDFVAQIIFDVGPVAQSVLRLTTSWTVRDRIPMGKSISARLDRPWGRPSLVYNGYRVFAGGKVRPGCDADHSLPSSAAVMEE